MGVGGLAGLLDDAADFGTLLFLNRDHEVGAEEDVEIGRTQRAVGQEADHLQDGEEIPLALFDLGALVAMAAILNVQRMEVVAFRQTIEFGTRGVGDVVPLHLRQDTVYS